MAADIGAVGDRGLHSGGSRTEFTPRGIGKRGRDLKLLAAVALGLVVIGILIVSFVAATGGEHGAWMLWIAIPFLMIGLGYFYVVNALAYVWGKSSGQQDEGEGKEESPKK